jgi:bifunctional DNase/RNase
MTAARVVQLQGDIVVLLEDGPQTKLLPIGIGLSEGQAIQLGLSRIVPPRPLTHNLLESVIKTLGSLHRLEIVSLDGKTFIGRLIVKDARGRVHSIDARPSDLIALSVNSKEPVWVEQKVLDKAGIPHPSPARPPVGGGGTPNA